MLLEAVSFCKKSDPSEMGHFWWDFVGVKSAPVSVWGASLSNESLQEPPRGCFFATLEAPGAVLEASGVARSRFFL